MIDDRFRLTRELVALRAIRELRPGQYVNLGAGLPLLIGHLLPDDLPITLQSENGVLDFGGTPHDPADIDPDLVNAGGQFITERPGTAYFSLTDSFAMIRGGHIDVAILGALQVSERGDLANWSVPGRNGPGIGGAMDIATGVKRVVVTMEHIDKQGRPKLVKTLTYPLTARACVDLIITDLAVCGVTPAGLELREIAPGWTPDEVQALTEPALLVADDLKEMEL